MTANIINCIVVCRDSEGVTEIGQINVPKEKFDKVMKFEALLPEHQKLVDKELAMGRDVTVSLYPEKIEFISKPEDQVPDTVLKLALSQVHLTEAYDDDVTRYGRAISTFHFCPADRAFLKVAIEAVAEDVQPPQTEETTLPVEVEVNQIEEVTPPVEEEPDFIFSFR